MKKQITIAALAATLVAGVAMAQPGGHMERMFDRADADASGGITRDEARAALAERFARMDGDGDGSVTLDEFGPRHGKSGMGRHGGGGDDARIEQRFGRLDGNGDGAVSLDEMKAGAAAREERREAMRTERFAEFDADTSGGISEDEFVSGAVEHMFERTDTDGDGTVTRAEMEAARDAMRDARKARMAE